jgi:hypothetical protein
VLGAGWLALPAPALLPVCVGWAIGAWAAAGVFVWHARAEAKEATA